MNSISAAMWVVLLVPALVAAVVVWQRPKIALSATRRLDDWLESQKQAAHGRTTIAAKFIVMPLVRLFLILGAAVRGISDEFLRVAVRTAASAYVIYLLVFTLAVVLGIFGGLIAFIGAVAALVVGLRRLKARQARLRLEATRAAEAPDRMAWEALGPTAEARERNIELMFDNPGSRVSYGTRWYFTGKARGAGGEWMYDENCFLEFRVTRSLSAMEPLERASLLLVYRLFNAEQISAEEFDYFRFAFINGNDKAAIDTWSYSFPSDEYAAEAGVTNGPDVVRFCRDRWAASFNNAVVKLIALRGQPPMAVPGVQGADIGAGAG
jgi:hypothetical protein